MRTRGIQALFGGTPLTIATVNGCIDKVRNLIAAKVDLNEKGLWNNTALILSIHFLEFDIALELVKEKADINIKGDGGTTALIESIKRAYLQPDVIQKLIKSGANLELRDSHFSSALDVAISEKKLNLVSMLLTNNAKVVNAQNLFEFLKTCDQRDPDVMSCLTMMLGQLKTAGGLSDESKNIEAYYNNLKLLHDTTRDKTIEIINTVTNNKIPRVLSSIIQDYDVALEHCNLLEAKMI